MNDSEKGASVSVAKVTEKNIRFVFVASLILKAVGAAAQLVFGFVLLFTSNVSEIVLSLIHKELIEDPGDFVATHLAGAASNLSPGFQFFGAAYLISHGIVKAVLIWALLKNRLWAYPAALIVFSLFIVYQTLHFSSGNWIVLGPLTAFELALLYLIYHEYRFLKRKRAK